jgi:hypothetical protein
MTASPCCDADGQPEVGRCASVDSSRLPRPTAALAPELGGRSVVAPHDTGIARQAVLTDPGGAELSVSKVIVPG